jgi:hypothetical protein
MKKIIALLILSLSMVCSKAQQNVSNNFLSKDFKSNSRADSINNLLQKKYLDQLPDSIRKAFLAIKQNEATKSTDAFEIDLPWFGIEGSGSLNEETFKTTNGSLKATLYARPVQYKNKAVTIYASYNVNASNNDSILFGTLIFPEVGKNSFLGTIEWRSFWSKFNTDDKKRGHSLAGFLEFSHKNIKTDSSIDGQKLHFSTLNYTTGVKYTFSFWKKGADSTSNNSELSFSTTPYLSYLNIPDEDKADYQAILARGQKVQPSEINENIFSWGIKIEFQVNSFGIFADFRSVIGNEKKFPIRELKGFHSNIGFTLNTEFLHFK